jgi:hypothetical protein
MVFETGHPWITFKDPCNVRSLCRIIAASSTPATSCTEITLNTSDEENRCLRNLGLSVLDSHINADGARSRDAWQTSLPSAPRQRLKRRTKTAIKTPTTFLSRYTDR